MKDELPLTEEQKKIMFAIYIHEYNYSEYEEESCIRNFYKLINKDNITKKELEEKANSIINIYKNFRRYEEKKIRKEI